MLATSSSNYVFFHLSRVYLEEENFTFDSTTFHFKLKSYDKQHVRIKIFLDCISFNQTLDKQWLNFNLFIFSFFSIPIAQNVVEKCLEEL